MTSYIEAMGESFDQYKARVLAFKWLDELMLAQPFASWDQLTSGYESPIGKIPLVGQRGIWNPRLLGYTLSITSTNKGIYEDTWIGEDIFEYAYQGDSGMAGDNIKLRAAMQDDIPLIYFKQIRQNVYLPYYPVFVVGDDPVRRAFTISLTKSLALSAIDELSFELDKGYRDQLVKLRLHQPRFRAEVLIAYKEACAICRLKHPELLDAAHIIPDALSEGIASVSNGLALCKIHHAAYDKNMIGISPDLKVRVRSDVMIEIDGPMLREGIQAMNGVTISIPRSPKLQPNKDFLDIRFKEFNSFS